MSAQIFTSRRDSFPVHVAEIVPSVLMGGRPSFPFCSWAAANGFKYPATALPFLKHCASAAEAFFVRPFVCREGVEYPEERTATAAGFRIELQVRASKYYVDAVVSDCSSRLAVEIDGAAFHHWTREQVAADYIRQRRIVLVGYTVVRFTALEAFGKPNECWRQIEAILAKRRGSA